MILLIAGMAGNVLSSTMPAAFAGPSLYFEGQISVSSFVIRQCHRATMPAGVNDPSGIQANTKATCGRLCWLEERVLKIKLPHEAVAEILSRCSCGHGDSIPKKSLMQEGCPEMPRWWDRGPHPMGPGAMS